MSVSIDSYVMNTWGIDWIKSTAERSLTAAGINPEEAVATEPSSDLNVTVVANGTGGYYLSVGHQKLVEDPSSGERYHTITWESGRMGTHDRTTRRIRRALVDLADSFARSFMESNWQFCD